MARLASTKEREGAEASHTPHPPEGAEASHAPHPPDSTTGGLPDGASHGLPHGASQGLSMPSPEGRGGCEGKSGEVAQLTYGASIKCATQTEIDDRLKTETDDRQGIKECDKKECDKNSKSWAAVSAWDEWLTDALGKGIKGLGQKLRGGRETAVVETASPARQTHRPDATSHTVHTPCSPAFVAPLTVAATDTSKSVSTSASPSTSANPSIPKRTATTSSFAQDLARKVALLEERVGAMAQAVLSPLTSKARPPPPAHGPH